MKENKVSYSNKMYAFGKWSMLAVSLLIIVMLLMVSNHGNTTIQYLVNKDVGYNIYLMVAMINIISFFELHYLSKHIDKVSNNFFIVTIIIVWLSLVATFNYIAGFSLAALLFLVFRKNDISIIKLIKAIIRDKNRLLLLANAIIYGFMLSVLYSTIFIIF